jgi:predicted HicB family RNase H-like nuclease
MESKRPQTVLRFRTKKQKAEITRTAKEERFSLNEYILRTLEDKQSARQAPQSVDTVAQIAEN